MVQRVRKAVLPVAGLGTRFLPATKVIPKEMIPVIDKPVVQYAIEEARAAGIEEFIFVTADGKESIANHFYPHPVLEQSLEEKGQLAELKLVRAATLPPGSVHMVKHHNPLGLGHAVWCAWRVIGNEPFAVILADDLIEGVPGAMEQMVKLFDETHTSVLGVETVAPEETGSYGIVKVAPDARGHQQVEHIVEKPRPEVAPSNLAVVGRYILTPRIFDKLVNTTAGAGGEIQLTDGIAALMKDEPVLALPFKGVRYDCGSKLGYLKATVNYGLQHHEVGAEFAAYLQSLVKN
jgi:UTP--glucose-1-phosphate uridylyltransferase